jgi:hypothetical protein
LYDEAADADEDATGSAGRLFAAAITEHVMPHLS